MATSINRRNFLKGALAAGALGVGAAAVGCSPQTGGSASDGGSGSVEGVPIAHLYAVGNTGGAFYGNTYPSMIGGTGTGHGMTFGMLAAEEVMGQSRLGN